MEWQANSRVKGRRNIGTSGTESVVTRKAARTCRWVLGMESRRIDAWRWPLCTKAAAMRAAVADSSSRKLVRNRRVQGQKAKRRLTGTTATAHESPRQPVGNRVSRGRLAGRAEGGKLSPPPSRGAHMAGNLASPRSYCGGSTALPLAAGRPKRR